MYKVYILECADNTLYTGITNNLQRRFKEHKSGMGGRYTRAREAVKIIYTENHPDRSSALKREAEIKRMSRTQKLTLINLVV